MRQPVLLRVEFDDEDWREGDTSVRDGVLSGYVSLRLNGRKVLDYQVVGLNNSAISLLRSITQDHVAATSATEDRVRWPLFFCAGNLNNRCGVIRDFSVKRADGAVTFTDFHRCALPQSTRISVPWRSWARAVERVAVATLRRLPLMKRGVKVRYLPTYRRFRRELKIELRRVQQVLRGGRVPNKRMEPSGAIVLKEARRLCPGGHELTFNCRARGARVARSSCAGR